MGGQVLDLEAIRIMDKGIEKGESILLIKQIQKKLNAGKTNDIIASEVEESLKTVNSIVSVIKSMDTEEFDADKVYETWKKEAVAV